MQTPKYHILDLEVENRPYYGKFSSPFHPENFIVAAGWKNKGDAFCSHEYFEDKVAGDSFVQPIPTDCELLVGHNLRFDLHWIWKHPSFKAFIERGGKVWCTQYAEYMLEGFDTDYHMNKLEDLAVKYGGTRKVDAVKAMWDAGHLTSEIDKDLLIDYLIGTEEESRNGGDIGNTERVFLAQWKASQKLDMLKVIQARMDGYLCTTEMEYNGIYVDMNIAAEDLMTMKTEVRELQAKLDQFKPELPEGAVFNWGSDSQVSGLLFGGYHKYTWSANYIDENTGKLARTQVAVKHRILKEPQNGVEFVSEDNAHEYDEDLFVRIKSGAKKGEFKTKNIKLPIGNLKNKAFEHIAKFDRQVEPLEEWETKKTNCLDGMIYSVGADVIEVLQNDNNEIAQLYSRFKRLCKVLDTYYFKTTTKGDQGMLTSVRDGHIINHNLNHCSTVTGRMSSSNPNLQNIPRGNTAPVKRMFVSRYGDDGTCIEADYSQLEVVVQGMLTGDENLIRDLNAGVDFHCKRVSLKHHMPYEDAVEWCKNEDNPDYAAGTAERTKCKQYSFQSQYGAGDKSIARSTGMSEDEVAQIRAAEAAEYPKAAVFPDKVKQDIEDSAQPFTINFAHGGFKSILKGFFVAPSGTRYAFRSEDTPAWLRQKTGSDQTFKPTKIKNYPTQGTGGECMQIQLGKLFREFVRRGWWSNGDVPLAVLSNTVHDCIWADTHNSIKQEVGSLIKTTLEGIPLTYKELFNIDVPVPFPVDVEEGSNMLELHHMSL